MGREEVRTKFWCETVCKKGHLDDFIGVIFILQWIFKQFNGEGVVVVYGLD
jgi:hypothetical protein